MMEIILVSLSLSSIYAVSAIGLTFIFGQMQIVNWVHGGAYMTGAYALYYLYAEVGLNYFSAFGCSIVSAGIVGIIVERFVFRPIKGEFIASIPALAGILLLMQSLGYIIFGTMDKYAPPLFGTVVSFFNVSYSLDRLFIIFLASFLIIILNTFMKKTKTGRAMRAIQQDKEAAGVLGVNVNRMHALAFFIGCGLAGAAGALVAPLYSVNPSMWVGPLLKSFIIVILGGMGSIFGASIAALIIGFIDGILGTLLGSAFALLCSFMIVMLVLIIRPQGIAGYET